MRCQALVFSSIALMLSCLSAVAQEQTAPQTPPSVFSIVSGNVTCGDTGRPARFAAVQLIPVRYQKARFDVTELLKGSGLSVLTTLDGSFEMPKVPAGTYYVVAQLKGYISPLSTLTSLEISNAEADAVKKVQALAEKIVVQSASVRVDVRLERGGSISGLIRYDDGSPAAGVAPVRMVLREDGKWEQDYYNPGVRETITTDDRGHYRISGLPKGKYAVMAVLPSRQLIDGLGGLATTSSNPGDALVVYSGGVFRTKDIKPIEVGTGEEVDGVDIIFPLDNLYLVSGTVTAKTDNHSINAGHIRLNDAETKTTLRVTYVQEDGSFKFNYVPEGQYELVIMGAGDADKNAPGSAKLLKRYQEATVPIEVKRDLTGIVVQVADKPVAGASAKP